MLIFDKNFIDGLSEKAKANPRLRQHVNVHQSYLDPCQRLFNAIEVGSYIRPHRHSSDPKDELLVAVRGLMALVTFDEVGSVLGVLRFGSEKFGPEVAVGAEVPSGTWHTVVALEGRCALLEVKAGPFDPNQPKNLAPWAPEEGSAEAAEYLNRLVALAKQAV